MSSTNPRSSTSNSPARGVPYNVPNAALRGAALAFAAKPPVKPKSVIQTRYPGINGALSPANVSSRSRSPSVSPEEELEMRQSQLEPRELSHSLSRSPSEPGTSRTSPRSASIASRTRSDEQQDLSGRSGNTLQKAESAHDELSGQLARRVLEGGTLSTAEGHSAPTDSTPIAPTTLLVKLFEQNSKPPSQSATPKKSTASTVETTQRKPPPILAPKPQRSISVRSVSEELDKPDITVTKPILPPPGRTKSSQASTEPAQSSSPRPYLSSTYKDDAFKKITPHMTGDSLANAIVGAHLAASRQPTPKIKPSPPRPPSPRRKHHHTILQPSPSPPKREPGKLRHTLRSDPSSESESTSPQRQGLKHLVKKHPHKHNEGTRKHWRDTITERERKRYEGVWAANRGTFLPASDSLTSTTYSTSTAGNGIEDEVLNLVARDIWSRSRLPEQVLEEIWFLVDRREVGRLKKEEFVVGLWLIDQRLKGRKLPPRVGDSVWSSVTGLGTRGVKVRVKDGRKKLERGNEYAS